MQFHKKNFFDLFDFTSFFCLDFFKFSAPLCTLLASIFYIMWSGHSFLRHFSLTCPNHKHIFVEYIRPRSPWCLVCQDRLQVHIWKIKIWYYLSSLFPFHSRPENLKKSRQKNSRNQIKSKNVFFSWNCIFGSFSQLQKKDFWPYLKLEKMEFGQKKFCEIDLFHEFFFFCPGLFQFSGPD